MRKQNQNFNLLIICLLALFIAPTALSQTGTLTVNQDSKITDLLSLKKSLEKDYKLVDGYAIQLYSGTRVRAENVRRNYLNKYGDWPASIEYETPNYKVWVGNFATRLEADRALLDIHRNFPTAFAFKPNKKDD